MSKAKYNFLDVERKWQDNWKSDKTYKAEINEKPKYYVCLLYTSPSPRDPT